MAEMEHCFHSDRVTSRDTLHVLSAPFLGLFLLLNCVYLAVMGLSSAYFILVLNGFVV